MAEDADDPKPLNRRRFFTDGLFEVLRPLQKPIERKLAPFERLTEEFRKLEEGPTRPTPPPAERAPWDKPMSFALPVLLLFLFGIIQFGFLFFVWNDMENAAREGARRLAVDDSLSEANAKDIVDAWLVNWGATFTVTACKIASKTANPGTCTGTDAVFVSISAPMSQLAVVNFGSWFGVDSLSVRVVMRKEGL